ncbi:hypothetical protein tb265_26050 [Gemmatimonadetes bacterium T265]|nr:hypothetical protein tb265_26050 [Gemmatimonadetes bacterium T265]
MSAPPRPPAPGSAPASPDAAGPDVAAATHLAPHPRHFAPHAPAHPATRVPAHPEPQPLPHEPRWPALLAVVGVALLYFALPGSLTLGPPWLLPTIVLVLLVPTVVAHRMRQSRWNQAFGVAMLGVMTTALVAGLIRLVAALPTKAEAPETLLRSAAALWLANILVFASWYWRVDAGGPHARSRSHPRDTAWRGAFLFPQQTLDADGGAGARAVHWRPEFVDYLFLAFNTSTAFSPTDAPVLSRWAKLLMMLQSLISFSTVAVLAARAVNIL